MVSSVFANYFKQPEEPPSLIEVMQKDLETPGGFWRLGVMPFSKVLSWVEFFFDGLFSPMAECKQLIGKVGKIRDIQNLPEKHKKVVKLVQEWKDAFFEGISWKLGAKTTDVYIETAGTVSLVADSIQLAKDAGIFSLSAKQILVLDFVGFMGSLALFLSSLKGLVEHGQNFLFEEIGSPEFKFAMMSSVGKILLLSMSIFGMFTFVTGGVINRLILLSISTIFLLVSILSHYYKKAYLEPGEKTVDV